MADAPDFASLDLHAIAPIPLHPRREAQRGFNQAALLGRELAEAWQIALRTDVLARRANTPAQADAPGALERRRSVAQAFVAVHPVAGQRVLLADDVCTTSATLDAAARALEAAGAAAVWAYTFAREA